MEHEVDGWIAQLSQCKQLSEADVKRLCDKVRQFLMCDKAGRHPCRTAGVLSVRAQVVCGSSDGSFHPGCCRRGRF